MYREDQEFPAGILHHGAVARSAPVGAGGLQNECTASCHHGSALAVGILRFVGIQGLVGHSDGRIVSAESGDGVVEVIPAVEEPVRLSPRNSYTQTPVCDTNLEWNYSASRSQTVEPSTLRRRRDDDSPSSFACRCSRLLRA